jgi:transposase InsO family protein
MNQRILTDLGSTWTVARYRRFDPATAEWIAGQVTDAFPWDEAPRHLIRDRDGAYGPAFTRGIRAMGIRDHPIAPRSPWQNGHVERLIGSIRRESLDYLVVLSETHLRDVLKAYASYYNQVRPISSWTKTLPISDGGKRSAASQRFQSWVACIIDMSAFRF